MVYMALEWEQQATVRKGGLIEVVVPSLAEGETVEVLVRESSVHARRRVFGSARGQGHMREDFEEPLSEFNEYS